MKLTFAGGVSEQTAAMTSETSAEFRRRGCCSLVHSQMLSVRLVYLPRVQKKNVHRRNPGQEKSIKQHI